MPEYLAPGVYVEETSFRAKSIEGVGTSTTAFVGPTRKGPIDGPPELITSFNQFQGIYGGYEDLVLNGRRVTNYVAHAVRNYFNNQGSRLYVSRVYSPSTNGARATVEIIPNADATLRAQLRARFPGATANGHSLMRVSAPAGANTLKSAPEGSILKLGGGSGPTGARLQGAATAPFALPDGGVLALTIGGTDVDITFHGVSPEVTAPNVLAEPLTIDATNNTLHATVDGTPQVVTLPVGDQTRQQIVQAVNVGLSGGYARLDGTNHLIVGTDTRGSGGAIVIQAAPALGFSADVAAHGSDVASNNLADRRRVSIAEIDAALRAATNALPEINRARASDDGGQLVLTTVSTGTGTHLAVRDGGASSVHAALGFAQNVQHTRRSARYPSYEPRWTST